MLDIVTSYHCTQFQGKLMIQTKENGEKPHFGPDFVLLDLNSDRENIFSKMWLRQSLDIMVSYHHIISEKTNDPILRKLSDRRTDRWTGGQRGRLTDQQE